MQPSLQDYDVAVNTCNAGGGTPLEAAEDDNGVLPPGHPTGPRRGRRGVGGEEPHLDAGDDKKDDEASGVSMESDRGGRVLAATAASELELGLGADPDLGPLLAALGTTAGDDVGGASGSGSRTLRAGLLEEGNVDASLAPTDERGAWPCRP